MWYAYLIGYGFSVLGEAILVKNLVETLWESIAPTPEGIAGARPYPWQGEVLARIEGVLYVAFLQLGLGLLIGVWLILKVAGQWNRWVARGDDKAHCPDGPAVFNVFLVGNALTLLYAFVGYKLIDWVNAEAVQRVIWVLLLVIAATLLLWGWILGERRAKRTP